jgi:anti-anti-sigma factor
MPGTTFQIDEPAFRIREVVSDGTVRVVLVGELDLTAVPALGRALFDAVSTCGAPRVEVDLAGVTFLDCAAIAALVGGYNAACVRGVRLRVVPPTGSALRMLRLTGVLRLLGEHAQPRAVRIPVPR